MIKRAGILIFLSLFLVFFVNLASAQVVDTLLKNGTDTLKLKKLAPQKTEKPVKKVDTAKEKYINPGKIAGRTALFKSLIIPGWGQLYNNQILVRDYKAKGDKSSHFWQKTYTLGKIGIIYTGFTLLTISYIDNTNLYKKFLAEATYRTENPGKMLDPDLVRYTSLTNITTAKDIYKRNRQVVIFSMAAVYLANAIDAYVAARLHYFNIDDDLAFKVSPTLINSPGSMYGFNTAPALKLSFSLK